MIKKAAVFALALGCLLFGAATRAGAEPIVAVNTRSQILTFDTATPGVTSAPVQISGLRSGESVTGIDFRPATGVLYAIGSLGGVYTLNQTTGVATLVTTLTADPTDTTAPFTGLNGAGFGIDFNPTVDRLRVVSDANQNLRINVTNGATTTDTDLAFATGGGDPNITASAYTNNFAGATTTTLYNIDTVTNSLYTQNPPNNGTLNFVGALGVDPTSDLIGFDISGVTGAAFASFTVTGQPFSVLYSINLATGAATAIGGIGGGASIIGLAIPTSAVPEPATLALLGTGLAGVAARVRRRRKTGEQA